MVPPKAETRLDTRVHAGDSVLCSCAVREAPCHPPGHVVSHPHPRVYTTVHVDRARAANVVRHPLERAASRSDAGDVSTDEGERLRQFTPGALVPSFGSGVERSTSL